VTVPDFVEPLVGYRAWRLAGDALVPWSAGLAGTWTPGVNQARCLHAANDPRHAPPVADCSCGLYALAGVDDDRLRHDRDAVGAIVAWGDVEVHATGFRAQYAAVVALALPAPMAAARRYGVPLVPRADLVAAALEYGRPIEFASIQATPRRALRIERRPSPPLSAEGTEGVAVDEHLDVRIERGGARLAPTAALAAELRGAEGGSVADPGTPVAAGDVVARVGGDGGVGLRTPVAGVVGPAEGVRSGVAGPAERFPSGLAVWLAPTNWADDAAAVAWGDAGARLYAAELADARRRGADAFAPLRARWLRAHAEIRSGADVLAALRRERARPRFASADEARAAIAGGLRVALADATVAAAARRMPARLVWRLHAPEADVALDPEPAVLVDEPPADGDLVLHAAAATADDYFAGRLDLAAALRRREVQSSAPPAAILCAASVLKPLHQRYAGAVA
jgi:hypothetical protein